MTVWLSSDERMKFVKWLEQEIKSNRGLVAQTKKVGGLILESVTNKIKAETTACEIVVKLLTCGEK